MSLRLICDNIAESECDAIVYTAGKVLLEEDDSIPAAPGTSLEEEREIFSGLRTGEARITFSNDLDCLYVIHAACPVYREGDAAEKELLFSCCRSILDLALTHECRDLALPPVGSGRCGFPIETAVEITVAAVREFLASHEMEIEIVLDDPEELRHFAQLYPELT